MAMVTQVVSCQLLTYRFIFKHRAVYVGFVVERVALGMSSHPKYFGISLSVVIPPLLDIHSSVIWGLYKRPISGHTTMGIGLGLPQDLNTVLCLCASGSLSYDLPCVF
jgi:hypothetical protein